MIVAIASTLIRPFDQKDPHLTPYSPDVDRAILSAFEAIQPVLDQQPRARIRMTLEVDVDVPEGGSFVYQEKRAAHLHYQR